MRSDEQNDIYIHLKNIRVDPYGRWNSLKEILKILGYESDSAEKISQLKTDAFLLKAVEDYYAHDKIHHDVMLQAFGLLQGYYYDDIPIADDRRALFLLKTDYLILNTREKEDFCFVDTEQQNQLKENLDKTEKRWMSGFIEYLTKQEDIVEYVKTAVNKYIDKNKRLILPSPLYPKGESTESDIRLILFGILSIKNYMNRILTDLKPSKSEEKIAKKNKAKAVAVGGALIVVLLLYSIPTYQHLKSQTTSREMKPPIMDELLANTPVNLSYDASIENVINEGIVDDEIEPNEIAMK